MFMDCFQCNPNVSNWTAASLIYAHSMFKNCKRFNASLAKWKEPRRHKKTDAVLGTVTKLPAAIFFDAFRGATAFEWDIPTWMMAELSDVDAGVMRLLELRGKAPFVQKGQSAAWNSTHWRCGAVWP